MDQKVCIVTGANAGIGKQAAIQLANEGAHVIIVCRNEDRGRKALAEIQSQINGGTAELRQLDMASQHSIRMFAEQINRDFPKVDVLIHNAADFNIARKQAEYSLDGIETVWATNHVGPVLLTDLLLDALKRSQDGRVITVSSKGLLVKFNTKVDIDDPEFKRRKYSVTNAYYQSKRAQEMYTLWLAEQLKGTSVTANCIRVTNVKIDISRYPDLSAFMRFMYSIKSKKSITAVQMARTYAHLALSDDVKSISGKCFDENNKQVSMNSYTTDAANIEEVMKLTMQYIKQQ
jgi:NAD(P)-dependent dehydrogenase (short-subunit alcohol dehydrogenase family)